MQILLDTQVYLWALESSPRLTAAAVDFIQQADQVYVSAASVWEACVKIAIGKLDADPAHLLASIENSGFVELKIEARHAVVVAGLPLWHRDPFDRLLIAQALDGPFVLLTADSTLTRCSELVQLINV